MLMVFVNFLLLCCSTSRLLNFIIFSEMFLMNFIYFFSMSVFYFELSCGSLMLVIGAGETSIGFFILVSSLRVSSNEVFRSNSLSLCEGY